MADSSADQTGARRSDEPIDDWLYRCVGFEVVSPTGRVGIVDEVHYGPSRRWDSPTTLTVLAGRDRGRRVIVPVEDVQAVLPDEERIVLRASPHIVSTEPT